MSAFEVSDKHISAILQGVYGTNFSGHNIWCRLTEKEPTHEQMALRKQVQQEANMLMAENVRSYQYCYKHRDDVSQKPFKGNVKLDFAAAPLSALAVFKLIDCLEYQSCETDDYTTTEAYKLLCVYRTKLACKLPGYNDEKWSI